MTAPADPRSIADGLTEAQKRWIKSATEEYPGGPIRSFPQINTHLALIHNAMMDHTGALYGAGIAVRALLLDEKEKP